jgi:SAM-dependent methyltransferase
MTKTTLNSNWFETFFAGLALDLWRATHTAEQTAQEADFLIRHLQLKSGDLALDVPCGNGRHAAELARRGIRMTGIDISAGFLEEARRTAPEVEWVLGDMRELPWRSRFDGAFCWGNSFGYFDHESCLRFLDAVAGALKPGGRFMMDTGLVAESLLPHLQSERTLQIGDIGFASRNVYDPLEGRLDITYTFTRGDQREVKATHQWVHSAAEICRMLRQSGLEPVEMFGDVDDSGYALGTSRLIVLARRV